MSCEWSQSTVHGYFDGELDAVRAAEFERHVESCTECRAELVEITSLRKRLQGSALYEHASSHLAERIRRQAGAGNRQQRREMVLRRRPLLIPLLGSLAGTAIVVAVLMFALQSYRQGARFTAELIDAHVRSLQPGHLTDVLSTDQHTVKPWFDGKLAFIPPVSDFSQQGFPLVGGRLDVIDGHEAAAIVYGRRKHLINFFVWPKREGKAGRLGSGSELGYNWLGWQSGDMQFCLVSDASGNDLQELKELIGRW
ncbi:MAG TPA: anti-sigma factor [Silvibacterium sp.]|nr:anti-sigma factor [Silvibacterium sp.]